MAKLPDDGYVIHVENEEYRVSDDFAECLICLLKYGDTSNADPLSKIYRLTNENKRLKEELDFVRGDNTKFEEDLKQVANEKRRLEAELEESQRNNMELAADVKALEIGFDIKGTSSVGFRKDIQKLQEENIKLMNVCNYLQHRNEGLSGSVEMLKKENKELKEKLDISESLRKDTNHDWCELHDICEKLTKERDDLKKRNQCLYGTNKQLRELLAEEKAELKEQLEASSDLTMANELTNIFAEYTVADQKNRHDLGDKITEFRRKYGLE